LSYNNFTFTNLWMYQIILIKLIFVILILNRIHWSLLTFSWSSSSWFSLLFSWLFLSSLTGWLFSSGSWLFFFLLLSWSFITLSSSSLVSLLSSSLFLNSDFEISLNLVEEIFSESVFQHLWGFIIDVNLVSLDFGLFWNPIKSSFSFFLLNFKRNSLDGAFLNSFN